MNGYREHYAVDEYLSTYGYMAIFLITFLEGESIVILAGILAFQGRMDLYLVALAAFGGSFSGDQMYFTIGRRYGQPLLERWPDMTSRLDWAFRMLRRYETMFILSFRFVYGVRNVSPFIIGMSEIPRLKFMILNMLAAATWAAVFSAGGYYFGNALKQVVGEHQTTVLLGLAAAAGIFAAVKLIRHQMRARQRRRVALEKAAST